MNPAELRYDERGLVPVIVQSATDRTVLMLGYANREALQATVDTGLVHLWSRSRAQLWQKGATSGHTLRLIDLRTDCDADTVLVRAIAAGPTCHTGAASCFGLLGSDPGSIGVSIDRLATVIDDRARRLPPGSYTARLLAGGVDAVARKVWEEAGEVVLAAKDHAAGTGTSDLAEEAADLVYHLLALLAERGLDPSQVAAALERRAGSDGAESKSPS